MKQRDMDHVAMSTVLETTTQGMLLSASCVRHLPKALSSTLLSREGRGLGFVEFTNPRDAEDAKYGLDRMVLDGREVAHRLCS